ncbi:uncharacterized protein RCC_12015 [Ramularia collo-cygni]|uniref:Uncharacterized protein n=1 Tax=Ramularia collo-cygni TaxID=112498 RepID=A0A2D3UP86_9PEZI|nr:uncharacterized protein RCC_12015 [Ramularia collo-cygni]CZT15618.1 uncharacterized protein RCC_12015 [Ramularia collo-cygni]
MKVTALFMSLIFAYATADDICCVPNFDPSQGNCEIGIPACCDGFIRKHPRCGAETTLGEWFSFSRDQTGLLPGGGNPSQCSPGGRQGVWYCVRN